MKRNQLFNQTRQRLAIYYAGVMGLILTVLGFGVYHAIAHAHWVTLDRELESVAGTLHDSLELKLQKPGQLEPIVYQLLPNLCRVDTVCAKDLSSSPRHILSAINKGNYYIRMFDNAGQFVAIAGNYPQEIPKTLNKQEWQTLSDQQGGQYRQISIVLHTKDRQDWGYFQVGRNIEDFEDYLNGVKWALKLGLPLSLILVGGAGWWLSQLAMKPIYQSYSQIQQFTADAAHELRTPLAASLATVESALLMPQLTEQETRDILKIIERQNRRLTQLAGDLLLLARMDRQSIPVIKESCCLNDLVNDLGEEFAILANSSGIQLLINIRVKKTLEIRGNNEQLYRLVSNLIINAIQYTPTGGKVIVTLEMEDNWAIIQVEDTGIGIPLTEQKRVFDRFYRVDSARSRHTGGSGLGLAIALAITQAHQGILTLQSQPGHGSIFSVNLPL
ncbi:MAG: two-component system sensor histidine kinase RppB [Snowella sp.]|nr:two-component system sensor histidine kinase RppB [Snowella sp.]